MIRYVLLLTVLFVNLLPSQTERDSPAANHSAIGDTIRTYELPEIVVTASRMARRLDDVPRSVTVLSKEQIRSLVPFSVGELFARTEGSYVVGAGQNPGMIQSLFMRGAGNNQTAFFMDDVRITDPSSVNSALDLSELSLAGVQQVEIVRGSHSTLYGSSAIGGVVNMITEKPTTAGLNLRAGLSGGIFGEKTHSLNQSLSLSYSTPVGLYVLGEINNAAFKGLDATRDTVTNPMFRNRDRDGFRKSDLFGKVGFAVPNLDLYVSTRLTNQKADIDDGAYVDDDNSTLQFDRQLFTYGGSYRMSDLIEMKYVGGYSTMNRIAIDDSSLVDWAGKTDQTYAEGRWRGSTSTNEAQAIIGFEGAKAIVGIGIYSETMSSRSYYYSRSSFGVFEYRNDLDTLRLKATTQSLFSHLEVEGNMVHSSLARFALAMGARFSKHSTFGNHVTFEINPSFRMSDRGLLFGSISSGFNAPSLYQLFTPERHYLSGITRGNSTLKPERSMSYEIGLRQEILVGLTVSISAFQTTVRNAIEYVYLWDKNIGVDTLGNDDSRGDTYLNLGTQKVRGIELTVRSKLLDRLEVTANLSLLRGTLHYSPQQIAGIQATGGHHVQLFNSGEFLHKEVASSELVRRPSTANLAITYSLNNYIDVRADVRYAGSRGDVFYDFQRGPYGALGTTPVEAYTVVDLTQRLQVTNRFVALARVENIFNTKYAEIRGFSTRGRGIQMSLRYVLGDAQ